MPQPMQIGWIDFGSNDRNKILSILSLLYAPEAVDELGIGVLRDGFADTMFPGTSTIQTRAKYFLLIPYLLMELEQEKNLTPKTLLECLTKEELALIKLLNQPNADGVIGARAGEQLRRKPSSIYWNGLKTYGIFNYPVNLSLDGYARAVCSLTKEKKSILSSGHSDMGEGADDKDVSIQNIRGFWRAPVPGTEWRQSVTIELTSPEAQFLRERIIKSEHSKESMLAFILRNNAYEVINYDSISMIGEKLQLPVSIKNDYDMAMRFADFIYGANIRYNIILSERGNEDANEEWDMWYKSVTRGFMQGYDVNEAFNRLGISGRNRARLLPFMSRWKQAVVEGDEPAMDKLIIAREIELKGKERAKLNNDGVLRWKKGIWLGGGKLQFRYRNARRIIEDIFHGMDGDVSV